MTAPLPRGEFPMPGLRGVPDGLAAYAQPTRSDSTFSTDRQNRPKVTRIHLRAHNDKVPERPSGVLGDSDWRWLTSAPRRWNTIVTKFGEPTQALQICHALARAGCGATEHRFQAGGIQHPPIRWIPHPRLLEDQAATNRQRQDTRGELVAAASVLGAQIKHEWPGVAASLTTTTHDTKLTWILRAAQDLHDGRSHDGIRAFVQAHHPEDDKAREDLTRLLRETGWEPEAIRQLGVDRSPYIGVGGPMKARLGERTLDFTGWPGPHDLRLPHHLEINLSCALGVETLAIIENRQAAETICDEHPDIAVIWCRGHHSDRVLDLIAQAAGTAQQTVICADADLGGLRITKRIHDRLKGPIPLEVIDIGAFLHAPGRILSMDVKAQLASHGREGGPIGRFATAILERGYVVTQEAAVRRAFQHWLDAWVDQEK